jgi:hypothetical protein
MNQQSSGAQSGNISGAITLKFLRIAALITFLAANLLYFYTLAPSVTFVDSGELAAVIATDGVSHPSGSPLYLLFGKIIKVIPVSSLIRRLNFFSAICAAFSVALTTIVFRKFAENLDPIKPARLPAKRKKDKKDKKDKKAKDQPKEASLVSIALIAGALAAGFAWMSNLALWSSATVTEVYALHALLITLVALLVWIYRIESVRKDASRIPALPLAAFASGLAISNYPPFGILAPAVLAVIFKTEGWKFIYRWKRLILLILCLSAGLLPYILLPIRAGYDPLLNWGNPSNWENFWKHVSAQQYQIFLGSPRLTLLPNAFRLWWNQWPFYVWFMIIPGVIWLFAKNRAAFWFTAIAGGANLLYLLTYDITDVSSAPSDFYVYILPLSWASTIWIGSAVAWLVNLFVSVRENLVLALLLSIFPLAAVPANWSEGNHRDYTYADDFARSILQAVAPNSLLLCPDWAFVSPSLYLQHAANLRPDVIVLDGELLRRSWYFPYLQKRDPQFYQLNRANIDAFLTELLKYEQGRPFVPEVITGKYIALLNGLLASGLQNGRPPYILLNLESKELDPERVRQMEAALGRPPYMTPGVRPDLIGNGYNWVPETPAFRLTAGPAGGKLIDVQIPPKPFPPDRHYDIVTRGIIRRYAEFWRWRGDYYRRLSNCADAVPAYRKALELVSDLSEAQAGLTACE